MSDNCIEYAFATTSSDKADVSMFYRSMFPTSSRVIELLEWRIRSPMSSGGVSTFVARSSGNIVGAMNLVPFDLGVGSRVVSAAWQQDSIVSPNLRGQGVGRELVNRSAAEFDIILAKGTSDAMYKLRKASGFQDVANSNYLVRILSVTRFGSSLKHRVYGAGLTAVSLLFRRPERFPVATHDVDRFTQDFDGLREQPQGQPTIRPLKGQDFLNWRYLHCPGRQYRLLKATEGDAIKGAAVIRVGTQSWIVDLVGDHSDHKTMAALIGGSIQRCRDGGAASIHAFATSKALRDCLQRQGFVALPMTPRFTYRSRSACDPLDEAFRNAFDWAFCHGDGDVELYD